MVDGAVVDAANARTNERKEARMHEKFEICPRHFPCLECYRRLPHPRLSFVVSVVRFSYFSHFSSLVSVVYRTCTKTLFGFFMVLETFLRSPRVHPFYNPTLAEWRSPSRMTRQTSISFKDSLEHPLEDAAWRLPHAARARQITNNKRIRSPARPP